MRRFCHALSVSTLVVCAAYGAAAAETLSLQPTTTLAEQTSNNTSAADSFRGQANGNAAPGNVSKVDVHSLLYPGATTKIYAHLMLWYGGANHMDVGYSSVDSAQVRRQVQDMIERGIDGVIIDWYGPGNSIDQATRLVMAEAEAHPGFTFAIMVDKGAIQWNSCSGCDPQQALIQQLQYVEQTYFVSPAYLRWEGLPVVSEFDIDLFYDIDWVGVQAALASSPVFLFRNAGGFTHVLSDGSYAWVIPTTSDLGVGYLSDFYNTGLSFPGKLTVGAAYKGFDDTLAPWGGGRTMPQGCGQTWLQTFATVNSIYNSSQQLAALQLVTWNDYEEGTEIESGIDNCVRVAAGVSDSSLQWSIQGEEDTLDHYAIYVSRDGQNLMPLAEMASGNRSLNLCSYALAPDNYVLYVQAVGKPSLKNQMSGPVAYTPSCLEAAQNIRLDISPSSISVTQGHSGSTQVVVSPLSGTFPDPVALTCSNLPAGLSCSFAPSTVTPGDGSASSTLTVFMVSGPLAQSRSPQGQTTLPVALWGLGFGAAGIVLAGNLSGRRFLQILWVGVVVGIASSCGGSQDVMVVQEALKSRAHGTYTVTVHGQSGAVQASADVVVTIR